MELSPDFPVTPALDVNFFVKGQPDEIKRLLDGGRVLLLGRHDLDWEVRMRDGMSSVSMGEGLRARKHKDDKILANLHCPICPFASDDVGPRGF